MNPDRSAIVERVSAILKTHAKADIEISENVRIAADLAIDSVEMFDLVMEIEDAYDISFPIEQASAIDTVGSLVDAISRLSNA